LIVDHIFDCLVGWKYFIDYSSIADLGTGGGLPGILLGIIFNEKRIVLVDKSIKKTLFLTDTVKGLGLKNITVVNDVINDKVLNVDAVTCRAFKSISEIIRMTEKFFNKNGKYILYKATIVKINEELNEAKNKYNFNYSINKVDLIQGKERNIILINKK
jgi:16S rRNA (guanine527-N7)-methyltransferase